MVGNYFAISNWPLTLEHCHWGLKVSPSNYVPSFLLRLWAFGSIGEFVRTIQIHGDISLIWFSAPNWLNWLILIIHYTLSNSIWLLTQLFRKYQASKSLLACLLISSKISTSSKLNDSAPVSTIQLERCFLFHSTCIGTHQLQLSWGRRQISSGVI